jgi:hypothetical protein
MMSLRGILATSTIMFVLKQELPPTINEKVKHE